MITKYLETFGTIGKKLGQTGRGFYTVTRRNSHKSLQNASKETSRIKLTDQKLYEKSKQREEKDIIGKETQ